MVKGSGLLLSQGLSQFFKKRKKYQNAGEIAQLVVEGLYSIQHSMQEAWDSISRTTKLDMVVYSLILALER